MRTRLLVVLAAVSSLVLTGCVTITVPPKPSPSASTAASATPSPTPTPTPTPVAAPKLTVTFDGIVYSHDNTSKLYPYTACQQIVDLLTTVSGVVPSSHPITGYYDPGTVYGTSYDWGAAMIYTQVGTAHCGENRIRGAAIGGVPITTAEGISVGSTQSEVLAAGAFNANPGFTDSYGLSSHKIPGTESLSHVGAVGIQFVGLLMESGKVSQIILLANDYADI